VSKRHSLHAEWYIVALIALEICPMGYETLFTHRPTEERRA